MNLEGYTTPPTVAAIYEHYLKKRKDAHRPHLGGSQIGVKCKRALWYQFRHMARPELDGRMLRLFETGDREEDRIVSNLRAVGVTVWDRDPETGRQIRFTAHDGHFALSLDGVGEGFKESSAPHTLEFKTMSDKNFRATQSKGVQEVKPVYWAQCQVGMHLSGLERCAFIAVNKNTDDIYLERIKYDPAEAMHLIAKAGEIIFSDKPPEKISNDPAWYECKFCDYHAICHRGQPPEVNCRTCAHATPELGGDGAWTCGKGKDFGTACSQHLFNPHAMAWEVHDATSNWVEYITEDGEIIRNEGNSNEIEADWVPW